MQLYIKVAIYWLLLTFSVICVSAKRRDNIYKTISGASCFRRLNGTHQTGCSSSQSGSVGAIYYVRSQQDFDFLVHNPKAPPYAAMIPPHLFTRANILRLKNEAGKNVSAVLLINEIVNMSRFSHDYTCPNQYSGIMQNASLVTPTCNASRPEAAWNPWGTGLLYEDFPFPIFYIADEEEITKLVECFEKFNNFDFEGHNQRSLCAVEVKAFMSAAVNSEVCTRRSNYINNLGRAKWCDPLESRNVYATLFPRQISQAHADVEQERKVNASEKLILVTCRLDTTSMFDGVGLGAMDSIMGYATLISVAHMLSRILPTQDVLQDKARNVLFLVFNGESYDYIGSQRFVYDLEHLAFPTRSTQTAAISFENIDFMLDIGILDDSSSIKLHTLKEFPKSREMYERLQRYSSASQFGFNLQWVNEVGIHLPPTSAQSFLRKDSGFPAMIVNSQPTNKYYHSIYDDVENINFKYANKSLDYTTLMDGAEAFKHFSASSLQMKIRNISSVIAMALYETLTESVYSGSLLANPLLSDEFLYCFLQSQDCPLFRAASHPSSLRGLPLPPLRYISVSGASQEAPGWTYRILGYLVSKKLDNTPKENCTTLPLIWIAGYEGKGECHQSTQNYSHALSPAFLIENYDWTSGQYSTWTESTWLQISARIILRPSTTHDVITLSIGVVVFIMSLIIVYLISSRSEVLFENASATPITRQSNDEAYNEPTAC